MRGAQRSARLQQQRRLADARIATEQDYTARHEAAAEHAIEFLEPRRNAGRCTRLDRRERRDGRARARDAFEAHGRRRGDRLDERVPYAAMRALALPFGRLAATLRARVKRLRLRHRSAAATGQLSSPGSATAVPSLPTTTPAASLAIDIASGSVAPAASNAPSVAITVSPAPETSNTSRACAGIVNSPASE